MRSLYREPAIPEGLKTDYQIPPPRERYKGWLTSVLLIPPHTLTYFGPQKITEVPKLMAHHSVYTEFLENDLRQFIKARQSLNPKSCIGVILPEFVWLRFVTSYNQDTLDNIKDNDFDPVINREPITLLEYVVAFKNSIFGQIYYHLRHRPRDISEFSNPIKDRLRSSVDLLESMGEELGVLFMPVGLPQQLKEIGALKDNRVHLYEPISDIIANDNTGFFSHYLIWLLLSSSGQMDKLQEIKKLIDTLPQFHEGMVEELNDVVRLYSRDKKYVRFYDMGGVLKENNNRLVLRGPDDELLSFRLEDIFNQDEVSPLHLYKDAYDLTSILFVEAIVSSMGEIFKIDASGFINQLRRNGLIRKKKVEFNGHGMNSIN